MQYFPVVSSTLSAAHLGAFIQEKYHLNSPVSCRLLRAAINHAYLVDTGTGKYVFRIYSLNWRSPKEIEEEIRLLQLLKENDVPVSWAIPDAQGNYLAQLDAPEGKRWGVLFSFAKGEKIVNFSAETHFAIGEIMARMHAVTHNVQLQRTQYTPQVLLVESLERLQQFLPAETEEMRFMQTAQQHLLQAYEKVNPAKVRHGIVHLDIWFDNLNIYNGKEVTLFDFDFCGNGWVLHDIAYYMLQVQSTERDTGLYDEKVRSFLKGYESITPITEEEKQMLGVAGVSIYFFYLGIQCLRFENWSNTFLNEAYLKRFINLLVKKLYAYHNLPGL